MRRSPLAPPSPTTPSTPPGALHDAYDAAGGAVIPGQPPHAPRRVRRARRAWWTAAIAVALCVAGWRAMRGSSPDAAAAASATAGTGAPTWNLQLASGGASAPYVLVFGRGSGLHVMRVPVAGRIAMPARVVDRKVVMVSLGRAPLDVRGDAGGAGGMRSFGARARVITVFQDPSGTGVRTGLGGAMR